MPSVYHPRHPQESHLPISFLHLSQPCPRSRLGSLLSFLYSDSFSCSLWAFKVKPKGLWPGPCAYTLFWTTLRLPAGLGWAGRLFSPATYGALDFLLTQTLLPLPHKHPPGVLKDMETLCVLQMIPLELCTKVASVNIFLSSAPS